jgi:ComF family protein
MHPAWESVAEIFFPPTCLACGYVIPSKRPFCETCSVQLEPLPAPHCIRCCEPGEFSLGSCPRCTLRSPPFARAFSPFVHEGAIARAIHQFKYEDHPELAPGLAELLASRAGDFVPEIRTVCAIPLHRRRFRLRKYDQAQLLAAAFAKRTGRRMVQALTRWRATERQVGLTEIRRDLNMAGAFLASRRVKGEQLLLVDDVFTTGATARAASWALIQSGATRVAVLTLARAFSPT